MALVPGKLYKTIKRVATWQFDTHGVRDDDINWSIRQIVDPDQVMMLVRTLVKEQDRVQYTHSVILELVAQDGVMCRAYLADEAHYTDFFEKVEL
jgi:hypothetical protein